MKFVSALGIQQARSERYAYLMKIEMKCILFKRGLRNKRKRISLNKEAKSCAI